MKDISTPQFLIALASFAFAAGSFSSCKSTAPATEPFQTTEESSVKPGINDSFLDPDLDVAKYVGMFEGESREVYHYRQEIVDAIGLKPGQRVVDVGAGTGPFLGPFANAVGESGKVYAIDIAPNFVERLAQRAKDEGHPQVEARLCGENSVDLPADSVDVAFICDVYHHFEFPRNTMSSLHHALSDNGEVVIVDFIRVPGVSRDWILNHVRGSEKDVIAEMDSFGFEFVEGIEVRGLQETWAARFRKR